VGVLENTAKPTPMTAMMVTSTMTLSWRRSAEIVTLMALPHFELLLLQPVFKGYAGSL
jgi:hypothetical protein